jgi:signal transduction histidine kinase
LLGYIQLLQNTVDTASPGQLQQYIEKTYASAERLNALLDNLLTWSRLQRNAMEHEPEQVNLREIAEDNIDLFSSKAEQKQIRLTSMMADDISAYADFNMINTVIRNLVSNALKFTNSGDGIDISARTNSTYIEVAVADTGVGISQEDLPKLFRIDMHHTNTGTAGEIGTGLGLALCQELVERNGGRIWVESELGHGSTFRFTLPKENA